MRPLAIPILAVAWLALGSVLAGDDVAPARPAPNVVLIVCDNLGYGDLACYGSRLHRTPNIDRLAAEGMRLTHFYSAAGTSTPSRAALLTGCYPRRIGMDNFDGEKDLEPVSPYGLNPSETTLAEVLSTAGYATLLVGNWHLGDQIEFLPTRHGFDDYFGVPYADNLTPRAGEVWPPLPLLRGESVIEAPVDRSSLTQRYTEESIRFIEAHQGERFFLMLAYSSPGNAPVPFVGEAFQGRSNNGFYGDAVEEIDWSTGEIVNALDRLSLSESTIIIWTSDNGAVRRVPQQGSNAPLLGWAGDDSEGAMRVPCLVRWPGVIPAATQCEELCSMLDWLPTVTAACGGETPENIIDGYDITPLLTQSEGAASPYEAFFYYDGSHLRALRQGPWKVYLPWGNLAFDLDARPGVEVYHLIDEPNEQIDLSNNRDGIARGMLPLAEDMRTRIGDGDIVGAEQRESGRVAAPVPLLLAE